MRCNEGASLTAQMLQIRETRSCIASSYAQQNATEEHIVGVQRGCWKHLEPNGLGRQTDKNDHFNVKT